MKKTSKLIIFMVLSSIVSYSYLSYYAKSLISFEDYQHFSSIVIKNSLLHPFEKGFQQSLKLTQAVIHKQTPQTVWLNFQGIMNLSIPLPEYTTSQQTLIGNHITANSGSTAFLTLCTAEELSYYFNKTLPKHGWMLEDQLGSSRFYTYTLPNNEINTLNKSSPHHFYKRQSFSLIISKKYYLGKDINQLQFTPRKNLME